jgi:DMSO/TMAO reductase YedYZ molybdopterin-dependent catalytic subunit
MTPSILKRRGPEPDGVIVRTPDVRRPGAVTGLLAAAVALGVGQLAAAFVDREASPIIAVGQAAIDLSPQWLRAFAISAFGVGDKLVLVVGILIVLAILASALGRRAMQRTAVGYVAIGALSAIGVLAAVTRPSSTPAWAIPSLVGGAAAAGAFSILVRTVRPVRRMPDPEPSRWEFVELDRRAFLQAALAVGAAALAAGGAGELIGGPSAIAAAREALRFPKPSSPAPGLSADAELHVPGLSPFYTPNDEFYRVDTELLAPAIDPKAWRLRIHGKVDRELQLDLEQLIARPLIERDITLNCVSNPVGGHYIGTARWLGAPLLPILEEVGVHPGSDQIVGRSIDGMTIGTPTRIATDGRDAMLAVAMNGEPLPVEHGFPVRMLVPGLYGYESATKWLVDLELTTFAAYDPYWVSRGWARVAQIQTSSRIDTPKRLAHLDVGPVAVAGVAWAQHRGIERVEVRVDEGSWNDAELSAQDSLDTWRQWRWTWNAPHGEHVLQVRATDDTGAVQSSVHRRPFPSGATGLHEVVVVVS